MNLVFDNAMKFNKRGSEYYKSASKMKKFFAEQQRSRKLTVHLA
jgi:hypothetical protein